MVNTLLRSTVLGEVVTSVAAALRKIGRKLATGRPTVASKEGHG
jgi:hypothetical protein